MFETSILLAGRKINLVFDDRYYNSLEDVRENCGSNKLSWIDEAKSAKWDDNGEDVKQGNHEYGRRLVMRLVEDRVKAAKKILEEAQALAAEGGVTFIIEGGTFGGTDGGDRYQREVLLTPQGEWLITEDAWSASGLSC